MDKNILFILLTFVVILAIIILADNVITALLLVSLVTNFLIIYSQFIRVSKPKNKDREPEKEVNLLGVLPDPVPDNSKEKDLPMQMYKTLHYDYDNYKDTQGLYDVKPYPGDVASVDTANTLMARRRARDKRCTDGWLTKTSNYYKYHYANELAEEEAKPWWGRAEI
jgi:hypothetical protein